MFGRLESIFDWDPPEVYRQLMMIGRRKLVQQITDRKFWIFGTKERYPEYEPYLRALTQTTNHGVATLDLLQRGSPTGRNAQTGNRARPDSEAHRGCRHRV